MRSVADRELLGLAIVIWLFLAVILFVAVRLMVVRPVNLWLRRHARQQSRGIGLHR